MSRPKRFNEDMIRRTGLPADVFGLIHDLCYDHEGRDREQYKTRAQEILKSETHHRGRLPRSLPKKCECGGAMIYEHAFGMVFSCCAKCTPVVTVKIPKR